MQKFIPQSVIGNALKQRYRITFRLRHGFRKLTHDVVTHRYANTRTSTTPTTPRKHITCSPTYPRFPNIPLAQNKKTLHFVYQRLETSTTHITLHHANEKKRKTTPIPPICSNIIRVESNKIIIDGAYLSPTACPSETSYQNHIARKYRCIQ